MGWSRLGLPDESEGNRLTEIPDIFIVLSKEMIMKLKLAVAASVFTIMAVLSLNANAASDAPTEVKVEKTAPQKKMRPHSHVEEKTGIPQQAPEATPDRPNAAKDRTKHFHPRDGK